MKSMGQSRRINPLSPVDLVIDHSVMVDHAGGADAAAKNVKLEFARNQERYEFLRWGHQLLTISVRCLPGLVFAIR